LPAVSQKKRLFGAAAAKKRKPPPPGPSPRAPGSANSSQPPQGPAPLGPFAGGRPRPGIASSAGREKARWRSRRPWEIRGIFRSRAKQLVFPASGMAPSAGDLAAAAPGGGALRADENGLKRRPSAWPPPGPASSLRAFARPRGGRGQRGGEGPVRRKKMKGGREAGPFSLWARNSPLKIERACEAFLASSASSW
jgi:hypothetical protein